MQLKKCSIKALFLPSVSAVWIVEALMYVEELDERIQMIAYSSIVGFLNLILSCPKTHSYINAKKGIAVCVPLVICACIIEQSRLRFRYITWIQQSDAILQILNYLAAKSMLGPKLVFVLPMYGFLRLSLEAYLRSNIMLTECLYVLLVFMALTFEPEAEEGTNVPSNNAQYESAVQQLSPEQNSQDVLIQVQEQVRSSSIKHAFPYHIPVSLVKERKFSSERKVPIQEKFQRFNTFQPKHNIRRQQHSQFFENQPATRQLQSVNKKDIQVSLFLRSLMNNFPQGILLIDHQEELLLMNDKCEKLLGCQGREQVQQKIIELILRQLNNHIISSRIITQEKAGLNLNIVNEIEDVVRRSQEQMDSEHLVKNLLYPLGSEHFEESQSGYTIDGILRLNCRSSFTDNGHQCGVRLSCKIEINNRPREYHIKILQGHLDSIDSTISSTNEPILLIQIKNVTAKHKLELLQKEQEFQNLLLQSFSHELRTPLNCSNQVLSVAQELSANQPQVSNLLRQALASNLLLGYQLNDILDFAALESGNFTHKWQAFNPNTLISEIEELYADACREKRISLNIINETQLESIVSDKGRIMQVLINCTNNSLKFTQQGGTITVRLRTFENLIECSVEDTGIGMSETFIDHIHSSLLNNQGVMKSMMQTSKGGKINLGLNLSNKLILKLTNNHENYLRITSQNQMGTKVSFFIENLDNFSNEMLDIKRPTDLWLISASSHSRYSRFPIADQVESEIHRRSFSSRQQSKHLPVLPQPCFAKFNTLRSLPSPLQSPLIKESTQLFQSCRVLIVDDVPFNHLALKAMLQRQNLQADSAFDGYQAVTMVDELVRGHCKMYQLILMDIEMPIKNGFEAAKEILHIVDRHSMVTHIVMCSAYDTSNNFEKAQACGMLDVLAKPVRKAELLAILEKYVDS